MYKLLKIYSMVKKIKFKRKEINRNQVNYINNRYSLINIEQLNLETKENFWFGLVIGSVAGIVVTLHLMNNKSKKQEVN